MLSVPVGQSIGRLLLPAIPVSAQPLHLRPQALVLRQPLLHVGALARFFPAASPYSANPPADSAAPQVSLFRAIHGCGLLGEDTVDALGVVLRLIRVLLRSHRYE